MDEAKEGVIVVSFGTQVLAAASDMHELAKAVANIPYKVLWKVRKDEQNSLPKDLASNIKIVDWLPQVRGMKFTISLLLRMIFGDTEIPKVTNCQS